MLKRFLMGSAMVLFLGAAVSAQTDWKGFYIGGNVGAGLGKSDANTTTVFSSTGYFATTSVPAIAAVGAQQPKPRGFTGGGQAGYNFQSGSVVLGAETDFGAFLLNDTRSGTGIYPCCTTTGFTVTQSVKTRWLFTARPRIGVTSGHFLVYGTGGVAVTNINYQALFTDTFATAHENGGVKQTKAGWTAGGGVEYQVKHHWSVKGEYLYANFGSVSTTSTNLTAFTPAIAFPSNVFTHNANLRSHIIRGGFNYRF